MMRSKPVEPARYIALSWAWLQVLVGTLVWVLAASVTSARIRLTGGYRDPIHQLVG